MHQREGRRTESCGASGGGIGCSWWQSGRYCGIPPVPGSPFVAKVCWQRSRAGYSRVSVPGKHEVDLVLKEEGFVDRPECVCLRRGGARR